MSINKTQFKAGMLIFVKSVWFFPAILTLAVILLCCFKINGSSVGIYNTVFYGTTKSDPNLLFGKPQLYRSDEYSVSTLMTIAQSNDNYKPFNKNVGNGQDMTILGDIPSSDWSNIFHPENIGFLVLPFDSAFALKWWLPGYLVILAAYFFTLRIVPKKKVLAAFLASAFILSPFFQWWYLSSTLDSVAGAIFGALVFLKILESKKRTHTIAWSLLLAYIATSFILILYPPFQVPSAIVALGFLIGYLVKYKKIFRSKEVKQNILIAAGAIVLSAVIVIVFILQNLSAVNAIQNSAYPGIRIVPSGGGSIENFISSNTSPILQSSARYKALGPTNQSELSNFILFTPFLLPPTFYLLYKERKLKKRNYMLWGVIAAFALLYAWCFVPGIDFIGKITLLDKVPVYRAVIGFGLANFMIIPLLINLFRKSKIVFSNSQTTIYSLLVVIFYLIFDLHYALEYPGYLGFKTAVIFALPFAVIVFLFMKKWYTLAIVAFFLFSLASTFRVNPIYVGTTVVTKSNISLAIQKLHKEQPTKKWVGDDNYMENFAIANGAPSLTATYYYPQFSVWSSLDKDGLQSDTYNRYGHANFAFDRDATKTIKPYFYLRGPDLYYVITEACDPYFKDNNVGFLMTNKPFKKGEADCATLKTIVKYPDLKSYIYELNFK